MNDNFTKIDTINVQREKSMEPLAKRVEDAIKRHEAQVKTLCARLARGNMMEGQ